MKKLFAIALLASFTTLAAPLQWTCDWPEAKSQTFSLYQGETATFEPTFRVNGRTVTNATIEAVWYQTNGMGNAWWKLDGATFAPSNDVGAAAYRFFVEAKTSDDILYRANGALRMLPSPGFTPNAIEPPIVSLDFSTIEVANAPYYDKAETEAKIVELAPAPGDYANVSNAAVYAAATNALQDTAIESNRVNIASNRVALSTLSDSKLDKSGGTMTGPIYFNEQGVGLEYDGENHRLLIIDSWNANIAYLEVPNAYDGDRVAFTRDISAAATAATNYTAAAALAATNYTDAAISPTSPAFSNAVLSVGLGIDTNTVAVINELVDSAHDLPVTGATSVGALLLALAAAVAALKKKFGYDTEDSAASATIALSTRTFPVVDATAKTSADTIAVTMPSSAADGKVSDMCLRIDTGASVPALTFDLSANVFIPASGDDAWGTLEASSHNVFSFTSSGTQTVAVTDAANGNAVTNVTKRVWIVGRVTAAIVAAETINES